MLVFFSLSGAASLPWPFSIKVHLWAGRSQLGVVSWVWVPVRMRGRVEGVGYGIIGPKTIPYMVVEPLFQNGTLTGPSG